MRRGIAQIAQVLRPTLGPIGGVVAVSSEIRNRPPEILDDAATIARRIIELDDPFENMGAMLLRQAVWKARELVGDGGATTALLSQALIEAASRFAAAGGDMLAIRRGIEAGVACCIDALDGMARQIDAPGEIASVIRGVVRDAWMAQSIGEVLDVVGWDGQIEILDGVRDETEFEYVEGIRWREGVPSPHFILDGFTSTVADFPRIFVTDRVLQRAEDVVPAIEACLAAGSRSLVVIAPDVQGAALSVLLLNRDRAVLECALALRGPGSGKSQAGAIEDLAIITGARCFRDIEGYSAKSIQPDDLGEARQIWSTRTQSGVLGGKSGRAHRIPRIAELRRRIEQTDDANDRGVLQERLGRLLGVSAVVRVGGATKTAQAESLARVTAAFAAGRAALRHGVVPGGGLAYARCDEALARLALDGDEAVGLHMLRDALMVPMQTILGNAGFEPGPIINRATSSARDCVFDVVRREWVDPWREGPLDAVSVLKTALELAASNFATSITIGALVRSRQPEVARAP